MKYFWFILTILFILSCKDKNSIQGSWIYSYELDGKGVVSFSPIPITIFDIGNESMAVFAIGNEEYEIDDYQKEYEIERIGENFKFGDQYLLDIDSVKGDSLVLKSTNPDIDNTIVCRRLPTQKELAKWDPLNKKYRFKNWESETVLMEFVTDSTFLEQKQGIDNKIRKWESMRLNNYPILLFTYLEPTPILVDSVNADRVYATYYGRMANNYVFEEIKQ
ncbi:MAG: hypothetical protein AAGC43_16830 [Bacteroidota bacterium]